MSKKSSEKRSNALDLTAQGPLRLFPLKKKKKREIKFATYQLFKNAPNALFYNRGFRKKGKTIAFNDLDSPYWSLNILTATFENKC